MPKEVPLKPEARDPETEQAGSVTGSDFGVTEGMEEGQEGGVVGGVPGGVLGGVVGGTGDGPVLDYDQPPRPIKITRPQYPQEAFVKKIEGTVELEILIDSTGRVVRAARREVDPAPRRRRHPDRPAVDLRPRDQERPPGGHHRHRPRHLPDFLGPGTPGAVSRCRMAVGDERDAAVLTPS